VIYLSFGDISDEIGVIVSPILKLLVLAVMVVFEILLFRKYRTKKTIFVSLLIVAFFFYMISPLFASMDQILDWRNFPATNTWFGSGLAFLMSAFGNVAFYSFILEVFYTDALSAKTRRSRVMIIAIIEIGLTSVFLGMRLVQNSLNVVFVLLHMLVSLYIYFLLFINSMKTLRHATDIVARKRFRSMEISALFMIAVMLFFAIDSLSSGYTIYSWIGWLCYIGADYFIYNSYI